MYNKSELSQICDHLSEMENRASKAQRESVKYKQCEFLSRKIGEIFQGIISSIQNFGIFVEIIENGCSGMIRIEDIESEGFQIDKENFCINNINSGESYRLGDEIKIQVDKVNMGSKLVNFKLSL